MEDNRNSRSRQTRQSRKRQGKRPSQRPSGATRRRKTRQKAKGLGIGTFFYILLFLYLVYNIISYAMKGNIHYVSAESGNIFEDGIFEGTILRNETVIKSKASGSTSFFVPEGEKVGMNGIVCSIDANGAFTNEVQKKLSYINDKLAYSNNLNGNDSIKKTLYTHVMNYKNQNFDDVYTLKHVLEDKVDYLTRSNYIYKSGDMKTLRGKELLESQIANNVSLVTANKSGIISYVIDGYEAFNPLDVDFDLLSKVDTEPLYTYKSGKTKEDQPLFKIIENNKWYIVSKVDKALMSFISDKETVPIRILDKDIITDGKIIKRIDEGKSNYIVLEMNRYFNEYLSARTTKFQVIYKAYDGIKIPKTALVKKDFLKIPKECITLKGNTRGVLKKTFDEKFVGGESVEFMRLDFYYRDIDNTYYVPIDPNRFMVNDIIAKEDGSNYTLNVKKAFSGVYTINKGYVSFKLIEEEYATRDYLIVKSNTTYGVRVYDRVIIDSKDIKEGMIIK